MVITDDPHHVLDVIKEVFHGGRLVAGHKRRKGVDADHAPASCRGAHLVIREVRALSQTARAFEWLKITGAAEASIASMLVRYPTWDRSTATPSRFISAMTRTPRPVRPASVRSVHPSPSGFRSM